MVEMPSPSLLKGSKIRLITPLSKFVRSAQNQGVQMTGGKCRNILMGGPYSGHGHHAVMHTWKISKKEITYCILLIIRVLFGVIDAENATLCILKLKRH